MELLIGENIRLLRKKHGLTQEQLAETLGVTPGAVYKWEAKLSVPDISLILELANFFDISVDALLGYDIKGKSRKEALSRIKEYQIAHNRECLTEAEKALLKYPNSFDIVYAGANSYRLLGMSLGDFAMLCRGIELYERSLSLISQNTDEKISELLIYRNIASIYISLGEAEKGVEILRKNNPMDINSTEIGLALSVNKKIPEAINFLSRSMLNLAMESTQLVTGYINAYFEEKNYAEAEAVILWGIGLLKGLRLEDKNSIFDKVAAICYVCLGEARLGLGNEGGARQALLSAKELAENFDKAPCYSIASIRFVTVEEPAAVYDDIGETAEQGIESAIRDMEDEELIDLLRNILKNEK